MKAVIFFVCLFALLLCGKGAVYSITHSNKIDRIGLRYDRDTQRRNIKEGIAKEEETMVIATVEEDEFSNSVARKSKLLTAYLLAFYCLPLLKGTSFTFKASRPFLLFLSHRYITQRALRI